MDLTRTDVLIGEPGIFHDDRSFLLSNCELEEFFEIIKYNYFSCWPKKFRCLDHRCVKMSHRCDGIWDCGRGEDEMSCDNVCKGGQFTCRDHKTCIPANR